MGKLEPLDYALIGGGTLMIANGGIVLLGIAYLRHRARKNAGVGGDVKMNHQAIKDQDAAAAKPFDHSDANDEMRRKSVDTAGGFDGSGGEKALDVTASSGLNHIMNDHGESKGLFSVKRRSSQILGCDVEHDVIEVSPKHVDEMRASLKSVRG